MPSYYIAKPAAWKGRWLQLVENPLFEGKKFFFAGGVRGGGSPFVWNRMSAKSLRQQAFAPRSGRFSVRCAVRKSRH